MEERVQMTKKGLKRVKTLEMVIAGYINLAEASGMMGIGYRQAIRVMKRYREKGDKGLNHGLFGKAGNNKKEERFKDRILGHYRERYKGFGPTLAAEKMEEEFGIKVNDETLRLWLLKEGLWNKERKAAKHRSRRKRKEHFGQMIQMDGSIHDWFEDGAVACLMNMADDATGTSFGLFDTGETTEVAMRSLYEWVEMYGIPASIYSDYKSLFYTGREATLEEQKAGIEPMTAFGHVCHELGIEMIYANSPQAKGRVERLNGVHQDRLVKEMRLKNIKDVQSANQFLRDYYWKKHNDKFAKKAASQADFHVPLLNGQNLLDVICYYYRRVISKDFVIRLENRNFQLLRNQNCEIQPGNKIIVKKWLDGGIHIYKSNIELNYKEMPMSRPNAA